MVDSTRIEDEVDNCLTCGTTITSESDSQESNDGDIYCRECYDNHYVDCESCNEETVISTSCNTPTDQVFCQECYSETFNHCDSCGDAIHVDECHWSDYDDCYCEHCYDERRERARDEVDWTVMANNFVVENDQFLSPSSSGYDMSEFGTIKKKKFDVLGSERSNFKDSHSIIKSCRYQGIEIEFNCYDRFDREEMFHNLNGNIMQTRTSRFKMYDWVKYMDRSLQVVNDGSVTGENHPYGAEIVMSPRRGDVLVRDLETISETMKSQWDAYISVKCGYHLHIDVRDYDWYHFAVLTAMVKLIEPHVFCWMPSSRRTSRWCLPVSQTWSQFRHIDDRDSFVDFYYDGERYRNEKYHDKRYHGLNLHSHFQGKQGLEIRYHSGTLNPTKMMHWSIVWGQIVDKCYKIGNELKDRYDDGDNWFARTPFIKSLQRVVSEELESQIRTTYRVVMDEESTSEDSLLNNPAFLRMSEKIREELKIPKLEFGDAYDFRHLSSLVGVACGLGAYNRPTMTIDNMFELFEIPIETRKFYRQWLKTRQEHGQFSDPEHVENCYSRTTRFVEYDNLDCDFKNVSMIEHRIPTISAIQETSDTIVSDIFSDVRLELNSSKISEYIET
tara:strand:+ start:2244 stop:4088 length:1845 start_codon:yes stop_codon:yes gene_type:complete